MDSIRDEFRKIISGARGLYKNLLNIDVLDEVERKRRLKICVSCEFCEKNFMGYRVCKKCGCYIVLKTRIKSEHCPVAKF